MCEPPTVGTLVEVQGLKSRVDLNGKRGWVTGYDPDTNRVEVSFDGPSREKVKLKLVNAVPVANLQSTTDGLGVGVCIEILGLQSRADLNGRRGSIVARDDLAGRIEVQLDGGAGSERVKVKPSNVKIAKDGMAVGVQVEILDLQGRLDLIGRRGIVVTREVAVDFLGNDRLVVHLDGPNGGERVKCKPSDVKLVSSQPDLSAAVEIAAAAARMKAKVRAPGANFGEDGRATSERPQGPDVNRDHDRDYNRDRDRYRDRDRKQERSRSRPRPGAGPGAVSRTERPGICRDGPDSVTLRNGVTEDRSRDWVCSCGERNFLKRSECFRCRAPRDENAASYKGITHLREQQIQAEQQMWRTTRRQGSRLGEWVPARGLLSQSDWDNLRKRVDETSVRQGKKTQCREASRSSSSSSSASSSESRSPSPEKDDVGKEASVSATQANPELDRLKEKALQTLLRIRDEPFETRKKSWRALLLEWHPDKHPDDRKNATAVFQFLQKGKGLIDLKGSG